MTDRLTVPHKPGVSFLSMFLSQLFSGNANGHYTGVCRYGGTWQRAWHSRGDPTDAQRRASAAALASLTRHGVC